MNAPISASTLLDEASVANRAMLFTLSRGGTAKRVRDKHAESQVAQDTGEGGWLVSRALFQDKNSLVYKYQILNNEMYAYHIKSTLPFGDDSSRMLPNPVYFEYTQKMQGFISRLEHLKQSVVDNWDAIVAHDISIRNASKMANNKPADASASEYPTAEQMERRLYINWVPKPISTSLDFRFEVPEDMKRRLDEHYAEAVADAGRDLYLRMLEPVTRFIKKLDEYKGEKGQRMSASFVTNLQDLTQHLPKLNINNDPEVTRLLGELDAIIKPYVFSPDALKDNQASRDAVKARLAALEGQLQGYAL